MSVYPSQNRIYLGRVNRRSSGFTLVELLMVIAVILLLVGITFGVSRGVQNAQARAKTKAELATISQAIEQFKLRYGDYPWHIAGGGADTDEDNKMLLYALTGRLVLRANDVGVVEAVEITNTSEIDANPKFLDESKFFTLEQSGVTSQLLDPWGNAYVYRYKRDGALDQWDVFGYHLYSTGANGAAAQAALEAEMDVTTGILNADFRDTANSQGIIFAGE